MKKGIELIKRIILFFLGMSIIQMGVALFLKTNIGSDTFTVFTQGLATTLNNTGLKDNSIVNIISGNQGVTPGVANMIILVIMTTVILLTERKRINIGTLICVVGVGPIIDLGVNIISYFPVDTYNVFVKMLLVAFGCFIIAVGFSILSAANLGVAPNDIVPFIIVDKTKVEYRWVRIAMDAVFLVVGFFLGGKVGIGTVISLFAIGPFIQACLPTGEKIVNFIVNGKVKNIKEAVA